MKPLQLSEDILPLGEFKTQASRVLRQLRHLETSCGDHAEWPASCGSYYA